MFGLLVTNAALLLVLMSLLALPALRSGDPSYVDAIWGLGFVVVAWSTLLQTDGDPLRSGLIVGLCTAWGLRLGGYLLWRWRRNGPDRRYARMLAKQQVGSAGYFMWTRVFLLQALLLWGVSLPVQLGQVSAEPGLSLLHVVGIALAVFGLVFETTADAQLTSFKADPANAGRVLDTGLWRYSRHPNYFGEVCVWWGLFLLAVTDLASAASVLGPLLITYLLLRWSGVGPLESGLRRSKPQYAEYVARTSTFVPRPRRAAPAALPVPSSTKAAR